MTKICIFARNKDEADRWAQSQNLSEEQYFYPRGISDLTFRSNFHVIVIGITELGVSPVYFEKVYSFAIERGKIGRI